jgi:hypothetical protein
MGFLLADEANSRFLAISFVMIKCSTVIANDINKVFKSTTILTLTSPSLISLGFLFLITLQLSFREFFSD